MRALLTVPSCAHPRDRLALLERAVEHAQQRETAEERARVEVRDPRLQGRLVVVHGRRHVLEDRARTAARDRRCRAARRSRDGCGMLRPRVRSRRRPARPGERRRRGPARPRRRSDARPSSRSWALLLDLGDARVGTVGLVDQEDDGKLRLERLAQHEARLRQRALARVDQQHDAVDHRQAALDLAAEVGVTRGVDDVDRHRHVGVHALVGDRRVLGEDRDALLALEVVRVHRALFHVLVRAEGAGLTQHGVDEGGLSVVDVRNDCDVTEVLTKGARHEGDPCKEGESGHRA